MKIGDNIREKLLNAHPIQIRTYKYLMHPYIYIYICFKLSIFHTPKTIYFSFLSLIILF
jgi:hypothetical protein